MITREITHSSCLTTLCLEETALLPDPPLPLTLWQMCGPIAFLVWERVLGSVGPRQSRYITLRISVSLLGSHFEILLPVSKAPLRETFVRHEAYWCNISPFSQSVVPLIHFHLLIDFALRSDNLPTPDRLLNPLTIGQLR